MTVKFQMGKRFLKAGAVVTALVAVCAIGMWGLLQMFGHRHLFVFSALGRPLSGLCRGLRMSGFCRGRRFGCSR